MAVDFVLNAEARGDVGKGASRRLRRADKVPAVMYGGGKDPVNLVFEHDEVLHALENEAFYSHVLAINTGDGSERAVLKDVQRHPAKPRIMHIDLQRVSETEQIQMHVPLHFIGEEQSPAVKVTGGSISHLMNEVEVRCLPRDLPEYLEVNLSQLTLADSVHLSDLVLPAGVELVALATSPEQDLPVVTVRGPRAEGEEEEAGGEEAGGEEVS